jgi:hypothetical protein
LIDQMGRVMKGRRRVITLVGFSSSAAPALSIRLRCGECRRMAFRVGMPASRSLVLRYCSCLSGLRCWGVCQGAEVVAIAHLHVLGSSFLLSTNLLWSSWVLDEHFPLPKRNGWETTLLGTWAGWESPVWKSSISSVVVVAYCGHLLFYVFHVLTHLIYAIALPLGSGVFLCRCGCKESWYRCGVYFGSGRWIF